jgi:hypothetical protein
VAPPTNGDVTRQRTLLDAAGTWAETTTTFDILGRPLTVTGPDGNTTTTTGACCSRTSSPTP